MNQIIAELKRWKEHLGTDYILVLALVIVTMFIGIAFMISKVI